MLPSSRCSFRSDFHSFAHISLACALFVSLSYTHTIATLRYFIPEDGDLEYQPNVFLAPRSAQPLTLGSIKHAFPLPGRYHFRFKTSLAPNSDPKQFAVWMDVTDDRQPVPLYGRSQIVAKVTRIGVEEDEDDEDDEEFRSTASASAAPTPNPPANTAAAHFDIFDQQQTSQQPPASHQQANLLHQPQQQHHHVASAPTSGGSLLDMNYSSQPTPAQQQPSNDLLGGGYPNSGQQQQQANSFDLGGAFF